MDCSHIFPLQEQIIENMKKERKLWNIVFQIFLTGYVKDDDTV